MEVVIYPTDFTVSYVPVPNTNQIRTTIPLLYREEMPARTVPHISEYDVKNITFGSVDFSSGKVKVDVFRDNTCTSKANRFNRFNICRDANNPMRTRFPLDTVREDQANPDRRGLMIRIEDDVTRDALMAFDEAVIKKAVECSKEWFGKQGKPLAAPLSDEIVRSKCQPLMFQRDEGDEYFVKIKVKTGGDYPTVMHLREGGRVRKFGGRPEHLTENAEVVPIVSMSYGIWIIPGGKFGITMQAEEMIVCPALMAQDDMSHFASSTPITMWPVTTSTRTDDEDMVPDGPNVELLPIESLA